jgi:hypothetical protein
MNSDVRTKLRGCWVKVFLHGRNEDGTFVNTVLGSNGITDEAIVEMNEWMNAPEEYTTSEDITRDAEALGFADGDVVVTMWDYDSGDSSLGGYLPYYSYTGVSKELTELLCGTKEEQELARAAL